MKLISTRHPSTPATKQTLERLSFQEALFRTLAADGGLYQPEDMPDLRELIASFNKNTRFIDMAATLTAALIPDEISSTDALLLAKRAFPFSPVLTRKNEDLSVLELFHGPSYAFKDFGASYLATCMEYFLAGESRRSIIITATSGDTGSAVAQAFYQRRNIDVIILYPSGKVSPGQEKQLTTLGKNIHALEVRGNFDDCQRMAKEAFTSPELSTLPLTSANSINIGRLLPQSFYYIYAFAQIKEYLKEGKNVYFVVPSGNFGNLTAGLYAWQWGLPVAGFIAATNKNDVVPRYLASGIITPRPSLPSYANAMDVGNPSNFERLLALFHHDRKAMSRMIRAAVASDDDILTTMKTSYQTDGSFICPHTATAMFGARQFKQTNSHFITLAPAHPAKFREVVVKACGTAPPVPAGLATSLAKNKQSHLTGNTLADLVSFCKNLECLYQHKK